MKRVASKSIVSLFLVFVFLPPILSIVISDNEVSLFEKRKLAKIPTLSLSLDSILDYPDLLDKYYADHFGLRDQFIALHHFLYIRLLRKSPDPAVTIGRDNWLYYNDEGSLRDYFGLKVVGKGKLELWRRIVEDRQEWLADQGIQYLMVVAPSKMMIYPEWLPAGVRQQAGTSQIDQFAGYLAARSDFSGLIDLRQELLAAKSERQVYFRTDTHWNHDGAYIAYRSIMHRMQQWFPDVAVLDEKRLKRYLVEHSGDLSILLHLRSTLTEKAVDVDIEPSCSRTVYRKVDDFVNPQKRFAHNHYLPVENGCPDKPLTVVVIHDSFGLFLRPYFNQSFGRVIYSNYVDFKDLKGLIQEEKPVLVIDERVSRNLYGMLDPDPDIERYIMRKHFKQSTDLRLLVNGDSVEEDFVNTNDIELSPVDGGLLLNATGQDPFLELTFEPLPAADSLLVHILMTSPAETMMQLFYTTSLNMEFSTAQLINMKIKKGYNELLFRLPHPDTQGKIRFDPGQEAGEYVLHSLSIRGEQDEPQESVRL